jgi:hypothetical protein
VSIAPPRADPRSLRICSTSQTVCTGLDAPPRQGCIELDAPPGSRFLLAADFENGLLPQMEKRIKAATLAVELQSGQTPPLAKALRRHRYQKLLRRVSLRQIPIATKSTCEGYRSGRYPSLTYSPCEGFSLRQSSIATHRYVKSKCNRGPFAACASVSFLYIK